MAVVSRVRASGRIVRRRSRRHRSPRLVLQHAQSIVQKMGYAIDSAEGMALLCEDLEPHERESWTSMKKHRQALFCPGTPHRCVEYALIDFARTGRMVYLLMHISSHLVKGLGPAQLFKWAELLAEGAPDVHLGVVPAAVRAHSANTGGDGSQYDAPQEKKRTKLESAGYFIGDEDQPQPKRYVGEASPKGTKPAPDSTEEDDPRGWLTLTRNVRRSASSALTQSHRSRHSTFQRRTRLRKSLLLPI